MNAQQALEYYRQPFIPMFIYGDYDAMESERQRGEEAIKALLDEWRANDEPGFDFDIILELADRNRELCDQIGEARLRNLSSPLLARNLSDADLCAAIGKMQGRAASAVAREVRGDRDAYSVAYVRKPSPLLARNLSDADLCAAIGKMQGRAASAVAREVRGDRDAYSVAYVRKPIKGTVLGIDIETTGRAPERGYIINVGWEIMELTSDAVPHDPQAFYCGIPDIYREAGVPLAEIHHIQWSDLEGKTPFRTDAKLQKELLRLMKKYPIMAHNAAFEDSWFMLHLPGYAEARRAGKIIVIDSRHICRSVDGEVRTLPRESAPASLQNWARRRGTLAADENELHLGLDDTDLMLRTVQAEFNLKNMFLK